MSTSDKQGGNGRDFGKESGQTFPEDVLHEVYNILYDDFCSDLDMEKRMRLSNRLQPVLFLSRSGVKDVWGLNKIRQYCIDNRLLFRSLNSFSGRIPFGVLQEIKLLEKSLGKEIGPFWIVAPSKAFIEDMPGCSHELFAQTGRLTFIRIGAWGKPLMRSRSWLFIFLRNSYWLLASMALLSFITVSIFSEAIFPQMGDAFAKMIAIKLSMQLWLFMLCLSLYTWVIFRVFGKTSDKLWKSD
jgi:hypothetical protein